MSEWKAMMNMRRNSAWLRKTVGVWLLSALVSAAWAQSGLFQLPRIVTELGDAFRLALPAGEGHVTWEGSDAYVEAERCLAHPFNVAEQGYYASGTGFFTSEAEYYASGTDYYASGTERGVAVGQLYPPAFPVADVLLATTPNKIPNPTVPSPSQMTLGELLRLQPQQDRDVIVMVVDDFSNGQYQLPDDVFAVARDQVDELKALSLAHGTLVLHFLNALISATGEYSFDASVSGGDWYVWNTRRGSGARLIVNAVDLSGGAPGQAINTGTIRNRLVFAVQAALGRLGSGHVAGGIVINMSWVLLPCATVEAFVQRRGEFPTFQDYFDALAALDDNRILLERGLTPVELLWLLRWAGTNDPLYQVIHNPELLDIRSDDNLQLAFVAASGNFALPYQMLPAGWPAVVGVGAPRDIEPPYSNEAEVVAPGGWFEIDGVVDVWPSQSPKGAGAALAGTSYAAPIVSLFTAVDIAHASRCTPPSPFTGLPPGLASIPHINIWVADAVDNHAWFCLYP